MLSQNNSIGGYFELELSKTNEFYYQEALKFQSARSAYYALLIHCKPSRVWMPYYICDSMLMPLVKAGVEIAFYSIKSDFTMVDKINLKPDEILFYVNYFGLQSSYEDELLEIYDPNQLIFDHSQSFFCKPKNSLATIYSPRKFFGVPDGGLLVTSLDMKEPRFIDEESINRSKHLLLRLAGEPEDGFEEYKKAEDSLKEIEPKKMSLLTERILSSIDYNSIKKIREENFNFLHSLLFKTNEFNLDFDCVDGPMVYPYIRGGSSSLQVKSDLIKKRCFVPTYWPECKTRKSGFELEKTFVDDLIAIPCDQRISFKDYGVLL